MPSDLSSVKRVKNSPNGINMEFHAKFY